MIIEVIDKMIAKRLNINNQKTEIINKKKTEAEAEVVEVKTEGMIMGILKDMGKQVTEQRDSQNNNMSVTQTRIIESFILMITNSSLMLSQKSQLLGSLKYITSVDYLLHQKVKKMNVLTEQLNYKCYIFWNNMKLLKLNVKKYLIN